MEDTSNKYYNYVLLDTRHSGEWLLTDNIKVNYKPFYVGKGSNNRANSHIIYNTKTDKNEYKKNKILKIIRETGNNPEVFIFNKDSTSEFTLSQEVTIIKNIKDSYGNILTNLTDGGENPPVKYGKDNNKSKEVYKYHPETGEFLEKYETIVDAGRCNNIKFPTHIADCCMLKRRTCGKYIWRFEYIEKGIEIVSKKWDKIYFNILQAQKEDIILEFYSTKEVYNFLGLPNKGGLNNALKGKTKTFAGYTWKIIN